MKRTSTKTLWGGRFSAEADPLFIEFNDSLPFDWQLLEADIRGSVAYARALERAGVLSRAERRRMEQGLRRVLEGHKRNPLEVVRSRAEDVHTYVEQALEKKIGPLALKLHTGRSRNDQVATDLRLYLINKNREIEESLNGLLAALASLAGRSGEAILPGYTHLQQAQPVLFSHFLLAYGEMFLRDRLRLREAIVRAGVCPLGSGALSGTIYSVNRDQLARELGFASASDNSMDAVADRDFVLDFLYFASTLLVHLSRLAEDLVLYNSAEFGFVRLPDSVSTGSSLMPQKKNPDALELIRAKSGRVFGHLVSLLTVLKGLPMTYNKDMQEDKEGLFDAVKTVEGSLAMMTLVLKRIEIRSDRMRAANDHGYLTATELADYLVAKKVPFRRAHELVGRIVLRASELGITLQELSLEEYRRFSPLFAPDLYRVLAPERSIARRRERGGTAPREVARALLKFKKKINGK